MLQERKQQKCKMDKIVPELMSGDGKPADLGDADVFKGGFTVPDRDLAEGSEEVGKINLRMII
jgi:hypothetical protein